MSSKYSNWTREQLIEELNKLKKRKKFGIVWEDKLEDVLEKCKNELPVLEEVKEKEIISDPQNPDNILIEGDNYHALSVLNYTHKGKIDVIYADPPYNTGAKDWKYNNDYVDKNDGYRHSKWLSMMNNRLRLAKDLLSKDGIICVTIDDYEVSRLSMLMDEIFGENNHLGTIVIRNNPSGRSTERGFSIAHEYALFYTRSEKPKIGRLVRTEAQIARYKEKDSTGSFEWVNFRKHGSLRKESPKMFYPIYLTKTTIRIPEVRWDTTTQEWNALEDPVGDEVVVFPIDENGFDRRWKWGIERAKTEISEMKVGLDRNKKLAVYIKARMNDEGMLPLTWWDKKEYSATSYGTNMLKDIFRSLQVFSYPKSLYAVIDCIKVMSEKKDCTVLDFFAGSGTTGHAVALLNKEDGGQRKFILCTNNENNIAEEVTYPRIKKIIEGVKDLPDITGLSSNLRYYKTGFVPSKQTDSNKLKLVSKSTEMLCLKEECYYQVKKEKHYKIFKNNKEKYLGIIYDDDGIIEFKNEVKSLGKHINTYVFSLDDSAREEEFEDMLDLVNLKPIPEVILNVYRRIFK